MLVAQNRPRDLDWRHAGPLLFGDWGTSRLYVLGLAFYYTGHASVPYLAVMSLIMIAVAWAYTIICRCFPDGGGVYTAARRLSPILSVVGATLLLCDFIVTASLSAVEAFHYFDVHGRWVTHLAIVSIVVMGVVNWFGARTAGRVALFIAMAAIGTSFLIGLLCLPFIPEGLSTVTFSPPGVDTAIMRWESLVRMVLALSGLEAVANMTGMMKQPVARTAKRTIWPVLIEVVTLNFIFGIALNAMPALKPIEKPHYVELELEKGLTPEQIPQEIREYRETPVRLLAEVTSGEAFGPAVGEVAAIVAGIVFGLLLLSAVNTAIMAMVSVLYSLGQDRELPKSLTVLNYSGVPWVGLVIATILPVIVLMIVSDVKTLSEMYAIGVVGAIAINVCSCAFNRELDISAWERRGLWALGALMVAIELTIIYDKPKATLFASIVVGSVLLTRFVIRRMTPAEPVPEPELGWLAELRTGPIDMRPDQPRIMLAARGRDNAEYAVDMARRREAVLFVIFVRVLRVMDVQPGRVPTVESDPQAMEALGSAVFLAKQAGVKCVPVYVTSTDIAAEILDYTVTFGCETLIMGKSRRGVFSRAVAGDVIANVARHLPEGVSMVTRAGRPDAGPEAAADVGTGPGSDSSSS
jgi:amino acid transporter/nucleotide-binding universal stress UspA family protein